MRAIVCVAVLAAVAAAVVSAQTFTYGADISVAVTTSTLTCLKKSSTTTPGGIQFIVFRAGRSTGSVDPDAPQNLKNAAAAGYSPSNLGVYLFPCPRCASTGAQQVSAMMTALINGGAGKLFETIWLDIEGGGGSGNPNLYWLSTTTANLNFYESMLTQAKTYIAQGYKVGIYTSSSQWAPIVGTTAAANSNAWPLWYAAYNSYHSFGDFKTFGGWSKPAIHQYAGDATVCSTDMDLNVITSGQTLTQASVAYSTGNGGQAQPAVDPNPQCTAASGSCIDTSSHSCTGTLKSGLCSGAAAIKCCVGTSGAADPNPKCTAVSGTCIDTGSHQCTGTLKTGLCSGAAAVKCCVGSHTFVEIAAEPMAPSPAPKKGKLAKVKGALKPAVHGGKKVVPHTPIGARLKWINHSTRADGERMGETMRRNKRHH